METKGVSIVKSTLLFVFVLLVCLLVAAPVIAQDAACSPDLSPLLETLAQVQEAIDGGDDASARDGLAVARAGLALIASECADYAPDSAGDSRTNPVPFGQRQTVTSVDFDGAVEILGFRDGDEAESFILEANNRNEPAPDGKRYITIEFRFICERAASESCEYSPVHFSLVGSRGVAYDYNDDNDVRRITDDGEFFGGGEITVTLVFAVNDDDGDFVLYTEYGRPRTYFAVQPPA